ncbi:hypothetical protein NM208_g7067 [Fusarium decemcellulare]|uniref:Uncharacterized protein n=1 Tax=Fusarium decemcellulare TaxID=57161 RepID=A0ACC1SAQ8_9HYPO|nr:hypothetical protein NM208_g7067 [Fusarium decemcellulare]
MDFDELWEGAGKSPEPSPRPKPPQESIESILNSAADTGERGGHDESRIRAGDTQRRRRRDKHRDRKKRDQHGPESTSHSSQRTTPSSDTDKVPAKQSRKDSLHPGAKEEDVGVEEGPEASKEAPRQGPQKQTGGAGGDTTQGPNRVEYEGETNEESETTDEKTNDAPTEPGINKPRGPGDAMLDICQLTIRAISRLFRAMMSSYYLPWGAFSSTIIYLLWSTFSYLFQSSTASTSDWAPAGMGGFMTSVMGYGAMWFQKQKMAQDGSPFPAAYAPSVMIPGAEWMTVAPAIINIVSALVDWNRSRKSTESSDPKEKSGPKYPALQFLSPIPAAESEVLPEYLAKIQTDLTEMGPDESKGLTKELRASFDIAIQQAEVFRDLNLGIMNSIEASCASQHQQLVSLQSSIHQSVMELSTQNKTQPAWFFGWFSTDTAYIRAKKYHKTMITITKDIIDARRRESKLLGDQLAKVSLGRSHGAICKLRNDILNMGDQEFGKKTNEIRAASTVMCISSTRSKLRWGEILRAVDKNLEQMKVILIDLEMIQEDQAKPYQTRIADKGRMLLDEMERLAGFQVNNGDEDVSGKK